MFVPVLIALFFALAFAGLQASPAQAASKPSVYLLVLDEFPLNSILTENGQINRARFPNLAALADQSTLYKNHTAAADTTPAALSGLLTGVQPIKKSRAAGPDKSLFALLGKSHQITALDNVARLCTGARCRAIGNAQVADIARAVAVNQKAPRNVQARSSTTFQARQFAWMINAIGPATKPQLWFAHVGLPHVPWAYLENGDQYFHTGLRYPGTDRRGRWNGPIMATLAEQRALLQIQFVDLLIGQMIAQIKQAGQWNRSLIAVTADHGASNWHNYHRRFLAPNNFSDIAGIPLLVKYPNQRKGLISTRATRAIDVLPTIARVTGTKRAFAGQPLNQAPEQRAITLRSARTRGLESIPFTRFQSQRRATIARSQNRLPEASPLKTVFLQNVIPSQISSVAAQKMTVVLDRPWQYRQVNPGSGWRPAVFATGYLDGIEAGRSILITVNGRPAGLASAFPEKGKMRFAALLDGLEARNNKIDLYVRAGYKWLALKQI